MQLIIWCGIITANDYYTLFLHGPTAMCNYTIHALRSWYNKRNAVIIPRICPLRRTSAKNFNCRGGRSPHMANYIINIFCVHDIIAANGYYILFSASAYGHVHIISFTLCVHDIIHKNIGLSARVNRCPCTHPIEKRKDSLCEMDLSEQQPYPLLCGWPTANTTRSRSCNA